MSRPVPHNGIAVLLWFLTSDSQRFSSRAAFRTSIDANMQNGVRHLSTDTIAGDYGRPDLAGTPFPLEQQWIIPMVDKFYDGSEAFWTSFLQARAFYHLLDEEKMLWETDCFYDAENIYAIASLDDSGALVAQHRKAMIAEGGATA